MEPMLCTLAETAALLRVSVYTVRRLITAGIIPAKRMRRTVRISRAWLENYVAETQPILLTRRQVARKLGISEARVRTLLRKGLLTVVMIGKQQRIPAPDVNEYVKRNSFAFLRSGVRKSSAPLSSPNLGDHPAPASPREPRRSQWSSRAGI
jgi:excisionase family DNA binding protein